MHRLLALVLITFIPLAASAAPAPASATAPERQGEPEISLGLRAVPGTPFADGDRLVARRLGLVDWYRGGALVATIGDPEGLVASGRGLGAAAVAGLGLLLVDASGRPVHQLAAALASENRPLFLHSGPPVSVFYRRGHKKPPPPDRSLLMIDHGGLVMGRSSTVAIFWGPEWVDSAFAGDRIAGIDSFLAGFGGGAYARTLDEYSRKSRALPSASTYQGHVFDRSTPPKSALTGLEAVQEACEITNGHPDRTAIYFVYGSPSLDEADFCAFHTWGLCPRTGEPILVAYVPNVPECDIHDTLTRHSATLATIANATAHELAEAITDPILDAWYQDDPSGEIDGEIADKCAYAFPRRATRLRNGTFWKLQPLWSNAAYLAGSGQANLQGQLGCK